MVLGLRQKLGILVFIKTAPVAKLLPWQCIKGVIVFLLWCTFMVLSFRNTASIFPEISLIHYLTIFSCKQYDVITDLICIIEKRQSLKRKTIFQKEKRHSSVFWNAFQTSRKCFSCHRHFKGKKGMNSLPFSHVVISYPPYRENRYLQIRNTLGLNSYLGLFALCKKIFWFTS